MLDCKILKTDYSVAYGSVTLKSLQNDNVPELDLLVREAIQNSSDASLNEKDESFTVNFHLGVFEPEQFNTYLTNIENIMNKRFPYSQAYFLEIRDTKTCGLTGTTRKKEIKNDDHGNFFKLIYDTGKKQTIATAGGNWGFGKSVYYRVGIGIVIFYSQIKCGDDFENRMIITLVEDENKVDAAGNDATILNAVEPNSAGKAWWGIEEKKEDELLPLTDMELIQPILNVFGIQPFKEKETGTSIIIPYIKNKELLDGIIPAEAEIRDDVKDHFVNVWASKLPNYLRLSIQKWYAPKIHNRELLHIPTCDKKWLRVSVDDMPIRKRDLLPFFSLVQELYTTALAKTLSFEYESSVFPQIETFQINIRSFFENGSTAGYVSMIKISESELNGECNVLSPYDYIGEFDADGGLNEPIVMFARDPGMIIDYPITGDWVKNIAPPENPKDFLFAFFVPDTNKIIKSNSDYGEYAGKKLGEYLRDCEASDHMAWNDPVKMRIVRQIQINVIKQINKKVKENTEIIAGATPSKLSNRLGQRLLPKIGYGKMSGNGGGSGSGGGQIKINNLNFSVIPKKIIANEIIMSFVLKLSHGKQVANIFVMIASEAGKIDAKSWNKDIGTPFPVEITEFRINSLKSSVFNHANEVLQSYTPESKIIDSNMVSVSLSSEIENGKCSLVSVKSHIQNPEITGTIRLRTDDKKYRFSFGVE